MINKKFYIGVHGQDMLVFDGYYGSGIYLKHALVEYGRENFMREVLECYNSSKEAYEKEKFYIGDKWKLDECYNLGPGGQGGTSKTSEFRKNQSIKYKGKGNPMYGRIGKDAPMYGRSGQLNPMFGKTLTDNHKNKISLKVSGKNNSAYTPKNFIDPQTNKIVFTGGYWEFSEFSGIPESILQNWHSKNCKYSKNHKFYKIEVA